MKNIKQQVKRVFAKRPQATKSSLSAKHFMAKEREMAVLANATKAPKIKNASKMFSAHHRENMYQLKTQRVAVRAFRNLARAKYNTATRMMAAYASGEVAKTKNLDNLFRQTTRGKDEAIGTLPSKDMTSREMKVQGNKDKVDASPTNMESNPNSVTLISGRKRGN